MATFQSFWFGDSLPPYQQLAMKSFVDHGHDYVLYSYKQFDAPKGIMLRDANLILPASRIFFYGDRAGVGRGSVAGFSNLFRYHLLHGFGNWWVDADVVCLSSEVPSSDIFMGWEYDELVGNAILKFPQRHDFVRELMDFSERAGSDVEWGHTGPALITKLAIERGITYLLRPQTFAYPIQSAIALHLLMPSRRDELVELIAGRPFLHIWNEILRRAVIFPWMAPPAGSLMAELFARHGIDFGRSPIYTADEIQRLYENYLGNTPWAQPFVTTRLETKLKAAEERIEALTAEIEHMRAQTILAQH